MSLSKHELLAVLDLAYRRGYQHGETHTTENADMLALAVAKEIAAELPAATAATDLLLACKAVLRWSEQAGALPRCSPEWPAVVDQVRAAIARTEDID